MELKQWIFSACSLFLLSACADNTGQSQTKTTATETVHRQPHLDTTAGKKAAIPDQNISYAGIETYLQSQMPQWKVPEASEWEPYWYKRYNKGTNRVYRTQADFDGNAQTDYAYILKNDGGQYAVWAFLKANDTYTAKKVYDITKFADKVHVGLDTLKAGSYHDLNSTGSVPAAVQTEHPAIHVIFFETAAKAYYWKNGAFHIIQTGD